MYKGSKNKPSQKHHELLYGMWSLLLQVTTLVESETGTNSMRIVSVLLTELLEQRKNETERAVKCKITIRCTRESFIDVCLTCCGIP